jgi:hypothetical protein
MPTRGRAMSPFRASLLLPPWPSSIDQLMDQQVGA